MLIFKANHENHPKFSHHVLVLCGRVPPWSLPGGLRKCTKVIRKADVSASEYGSISNPEAGRTMGILTPIRSRDIVDILVNYNRTSVQLVLLSSVTSMLMLRLVLVIVLMHRIVILLFSQLALAPWPLEDLSILKVLVGVVPLLSMLGLW